MNKITFSLDIKEDDVKFKVDAAYYNLNIKERLALLKSLDEWLTKEISNTNDILIRNNMDL